ncbi:unnamed protein product, partial [Enterobius vermicularis]|uniref:ENTH domain-containing protein n=1 Tax=Enterobius vermicularis TaxID=51028 RepID=A0A0N4UT75_ENTVE
MNGQLNLNAENSDDSLKPLIVLLQKALNKTETPLKQNLLREIAQSSCKEQFSMVFWSVVSNAKLDKSDVASWKFCHLFHKLIRDSSGKVVEETKDKVAYVSQLGKYWQEQNSSSYHLPISVYCQLLYSRICFLEHNPVFPGNLHLSDEQLNVLNSDDLDQLFETCMELLDQIDNLLHLQSTVFDAVEEPLDWKSQTAQGQCLLAPLAVVVIDVSIFYRYLLQLMFKLYKGIAADAFKGLRNRFSQVCNEMKKFFAKASNLLYLQGLVKVPALPKREPNFAVDADFKLCQINEAAETLGDENESLAARKTFCSDDSGVQKHLITFENKTPMTYHGFSSRQRSGEQFENDTLRRELEEARQQQERLRNQAAEEIQQCQEELQKTKEENNLHKQNLEELKRLNGNLRAENVLSKKKAAEEKKVLEEEKRQADLNVAKMEHRVRQLEENYGKNLVEWKDRQREYERSEREASQKMQELEFQLGECT